MTQCDRMVQYMTEYGKITTQEAVSELGINSPRKCISDLIKGGVPVIKRTIKSVNRYGDKVSYKEYSLGEM